MVRPIINKRFKSMHNSLSCVCTSYCPHVDEVLEDYSRLEIENEKLKKIKDILIKTDINNDDYNWPPKSTCKYESVPWNECPCNECNPLWHMRKILNME